MSQSTFVWIWIALCVVLANGPFVRRRYWLWGRLEKTLGGVVLELLLFYALLLLIGFVIESYLGNRSTQTWEFYAISLSLFVSFSFPGFVWRYLLKREGFQKAEESVL